MKNIFYNLTNWHSTIRELENPWYRILCFIGLSLLVIAIGWFNNFSGRQITLFPLNLIPVMLASWLLGLQIGIFFAIIAGLLGLWVESLLTPPLSLLVLLSTALIRMITLSLLAYAGWKIQSMMQQLLKISLVDILTEITNRRGFFLQGQVELELMIRTKKPITVVFIDIDNFKTINDSKGHDFGDKILQGVAKIIKERLRKVDLSARLGGDEFGLILPATPAEGAMNIISLLRDEIQAFFVANNLTSSLSIGIATFTQAPDSLDYALKCADSIMYEIKHSSKNAVLQRSF